MGKNRFTLHGVTILVITLFAFLAISSATTRAPSPGFITVDPDLPLEQSTVVKIYSYIFVAEYNGINVSDEWYPNGEWRNVTVTMPAGETHLLFDMNRRFSRGNTTYTLRLKDMELKFNFEAGKEYTVGTSIRDEGNIFSPKGKLLLAIWDRIFADEYSREADRIVKSWELGEF